MGGLNNSDTMSYLNSQMQLLVHGSGDWKCSKSKVPLAPNDNMVTRILPNLGLIVYLASYLQLFVGWTYK